MSSRLLTFRDSACCAVIKGWDKGVITMKKGEKAILTCKAPYAYGAQGSPPKIPPNATLNFEVNLLLPLVDVQNAGQLVCLPSACAAAGCTP